MHFALNNWGIATSYENGGSNMISLYSNADLIDLFDDKFHQVLVTYEQSNNLAKLYIDDVLERDFSSFLKKFKIREGRPIVYFFTVPKRLNKFLFSRK